MNPKRAGCCTVCERPVFDIVSSYTQAPLVGFPRKLGSPNDSAYRVEYALSDGSSTYLTFCDECLPAAMAAEMFPILWEKCIATFVFEMRDDVRAAQPASPYTARQRAAVEADLQRLSGMSLVGVIAQQKWADVYKRQDWSRNIA